MMMSPEVPTVLAPPLLPVVHGLKNDREALSIPGTRQYNLSEPLTASKSPKGGSHWPLRVSIMIPGNMWEEPGGGKKGGVAG